MNRIVQLSLILIVIISGALLLAWIFDLFSPYQIEQSAWQWISAVLVVGVGAFLVGAITHSGKH